MFITLCLTLSISASLAVEHTKHEHSIHFAVVGLINGSVQIFNMILIFWILLAFNRTLGYLKKQTKDVKGEN